MVNIGLVAAKIVGNDCGIIGKRMVHFVCRIAVAGI